MDGQCYGKEGNIEEQMKYSNYGYKEPDYSSPLYTIQLLEKSIITASNLLEKLKEQLGKA
jgi:hypothetical protein